MIIEFAGLPGAGKSALIHALENRGIGKRFNTHNPLCLCAWAFLGVLLHPVAAVAVTYRIWQGTQKELFRYAFINLVLFPLAAYARAWRSTVFIEHGFVQGLIAFPADDISFALRLLPRPSLLFLCSAPAEIRAERLSKRGWRPREAFGEEAVAAFAIQSEQRMPKLQSALYAHRTSVVDIDGLQPIEQNIAHIEYVIRTRTRNPVSVFFKHASYILAYCLRTIFLLIHNKREVSVLMYHAVDRSGWKLSITPETFEKQMKYLREYKNPVPLSDVVEFIEGDKELLHGSVAVTFDDGYKDIKLTVEPILKRYGIYATIFCPSDLSVQTSPFALARLTEDDIRSTDSSITFEAHGHSHVRLPKLSHHELEKEISLCADELEKITARKPTFFAYPFGSRDVRTENAVRNAGYRAGFAITEGTVQPGDTPYAIRRIQVDATMSWVLFIARLTSAVDIHKRLMRLFNVSS